MKQQNLPISKAPSSKKQAQTKPLGPVLYGQQIYIKNIPANKQKQGLSLWGRGFIDKKIYISSKKEKAQSQFTIEPKKGLYSFQGKNTAPVVFGAEVLIKHVISQQYLAIRQQDQIPVLQFQDKQSSACYFQFVALRTFQSNGNAITTDSIFTILHSERKLYITDLESLESLPAQPNSPSLPRRISKDREESILGSHMVESKSFSGSISVIPIQQQMKDKEEIGQDISFKKKSVVRKVHTASSVQGKDNKKQKQKQRQNSMGRDSILQLTFNEIIQKTEQIPPLRLSRTSSTQQYPISRQSSTPLISNPSNPLSIPRASLPPRPRPPLHVPHRVKSSLQDPLSQITPLLNSLPIYNKQTDITLCNVQNYSYSEWKFEHVRTQLKTQYLNNNDYIYFTHSQANQIMLLDIQKNPFEIAFVKNQSQSQYVLASIFVVEIQKKNNTKLVYLKHLLTGSYFPIKKGNNGQEEKSICQLIPLLSPKKNQFPPFKVQFNGQMLERLGNKSSKQNLHGFWLNKISKTEVSKILSIQNVSKKSALHYLKKYLKTDTRRRQKILRQFLFIPKLISQLTSQQSSHQSPILSPILSPQPPQQHINIKQYYQILFLICKNNQKNKKQCLKYIQHILTYPQKQQILDLLTELLIDNSNIYIIQKSITPAIIQEQIEEFVKEEGYSVSFMRIFRVFCGSEEQPSVRNQGLLFGLFFWGEIDGEGTGMTQSAYQMQKKLTLPERFKFRVFEKDGEVYFSNGSQSEKYQDMKIDIIKYLRQYFYLLSDCMNGNNYPLIKAFTSSVSFNLLLKLLEREQMKGPVLSLLYNAYLKPQKKYKPNIFHKDYQKICQKGKLISYCTEQQIKLRQIIDRQIRENKSYTSTMYRLLLNVFKMTIQNGYWRKFQDLIDLMNQLDGVISMRERENAYHNTYEEKAEDRNLLKSKITAISIKIGLIDMQVSLWASDYLYKQAEIQHKIVQQIKHSKNWVIDQKILRLCSTNSPQLLRKATLLLYKTYNLYKLAHKTYQQAIIEQNSNLSLLPIFSTLQQKQQIQIPNYYLIISACLHQPQPMAFLSPSNLDSNFRNLQSLLNYKQTNQQLQNMIHKLGLLDMLCLQIKNYSTLGKKIRCQQKQQQKQLLYWKLLTIYAIMRNNLKLRDIVSEGRKHFITLLEDGIEGAYSPNGNANANANANVYVYVVVDIIEEIYRNNRKLIISDKQELTQVCKVIDGVYRAAKVDLRFCKIVNLLSVFIETGNRKIVENHQSILKHAFTKNFVTSAIKNTKSTTVSRKESGAQTDDYFRYVLQIVIYDLLVTMGQKKLLSYFDRPSNETISALLLGIGNKNWSLKSKVFLCINFNGIKEEQVIHFLRIILFDLNFMCQSLKKSYEKRIDVSKEVKIYVSNIGKILGTIQHLFEACLKKFQKVECEQQVIAIKIVQRLFLMKQLCPQMVHESINHLLIFIQKIETRRKRKNQQNSQLKLYLQKLQMCDFEITQIKDKVPLIYGQKVKNKKQKQNTNFHEQNNTIVEQALRKKTKINDMNKNSFEMTDNILQSLKTLIISLSNVNKVDPTLLVDNIKQFLVNFLRISFLEDQNLDSEGFVKMQDILVSYQVPSIVCSILQQPFRHRYKLFCSAFQLGIKLLEGGHTKCQQKFLQKFREDTKNWIFINLYQIILDSLTTLQFYYHYKQDPTIKSYQMILQLQQYYNCKQQRRLACQVIANAFRFLQLLCENDHHVMKEYLYNQYDGEEHIKYMTKNFVEVAQRMLDGVFKVIEFNVEEMGKIGDNQRFQEELLHNIYHLPIFILDFLIQVCQIPAEQNQLYLCRTDFLDFASKIISRRELIKESQQRGKDWSIFFIYQRKLIMLLKSLLEQNSQQIENLMRKKIGNKQFQFFIQQSFIFGGLQDTQKLKQMLNEMQLNNYVQNIVDILIIKKILKIDQPLSFQPQKLKIITQLNNRIQSIHVDFKTHSLTVYFPFHPLFSLLNKKTKDFMLDRSANLTTRREKLTQLLISREVIYQDINNQKNSEKKLMNQEKMGYLFNFALFLCYLIIFLLVLFYSVSQSGAVLDIYQIQIISGLSFMQLLVTTIYTALVGLNTYPVALQKIKSLSKPSSSLPNSKPISLSSLPQFLHLLKLIYIDQPQSTHSIILLIISIYACFFQVRIYSFSLIFAFAKIQLLESILKSIRLTWKQLSFVCLLALAFSFIFGFVTLNYYIGPLYQNEQIDIGIERINQHCHTIITCVTSLYTQKIIGESVSRQDEEYNYGRFVSDLAYWGFFQILLSNIIAAIIIDKFAEQRNAKEKIEHERYSKCYICFADRSTLERRGQDFMSHVNNVHNLWNYFFYMYTLEKLKDITDFTGIQYWINRQVKQNLIDWIPIDVSFKDEDVSLDDLVQKLKPMLVDREIEVETK